MIFKWLKYFLTEIKPYYIMKTKQNKTKQNKDKGMWVNILKEILIDESYHSRRKF